MPKQLFQLFQLFRTCALVYSCCRESTWSTVDIGAPVCGREWVGRCRPSPSLPRAIAELSSCSHGMPCRTVLALRLAPLCCCHPRTSGRSAHALRPLERLAAVCDDGGERLEVLAVPHHVQQHESADHRHEQRGGVVRQQVHSFFIACGSRQRSRVAAADPLAQRRELAWVSAAHLAYRGNHGLRVSSSNQAAARGHAPLRLRLPHQMLPS
jgi:hypothetical protein